MDNAQRAGKGFILIDNANSNVSNTQTYDTSNQSKKAQQRFSSRYAQKNRGRDTESRNTVALVGPTAVQFVAENFASSSDIRQLICALFVDNILASVPKSRRKHAQKELVELMQRLKIVNSDYFSDTFSTARRPFSLLISKFVIQMCQQGPSITLSPNIDSVISASGVQLVHSRYLADFEEISRLGVGGFGKVFKVRSLVDNQLYAIKQIRFDKSSTESFNKMLSECRYHAGLQNEHVVRYHNAWVEYEPSTMSPPQSSGSTQRPASGQNGVKSANQSSTSTWSLNFGNDRNCLALQRSISKFNDAGDNFSVNSSVSNGLEHPAPKILGNKGKFWCSGSTKSAASIGRLDDFSNNSNGVLFADEASRISFSDDGVKFGLANDDGEDSDEIKFTATSRPSENSLKENAMIPWSSTSKRGKHSTRSMKKSLSSPSFSSNLSNKTERIDFGTPILYIQMELCSTTLEKYLSESKTVNLEFNETTIFGLLSAVDFLHKNQLIHRDIKPSNVLLKRRNGRMCALLGDFGLTREVTRFVQFNSENPTFRGDICRVTTLLMDSNSSKLTGGIGTPLYAAPEQIVSQDYGPMVDVYSSGIVFYELFHVFATAMERVVAITNLRDTARTTDKFRLVWPEVAVLIERMIPIEANCRWTAGQLLSDIQNHKNEVCAAEKLTRIYGAESAPNLTTELSDSKCSEKRLDLMVQTSPPSQDLAKEVLALRRRNAELEAEVEELKRRLSTPHAGGVDSMGAN